MCTDSLARVLGQAASALVGRPAAALLRGWNPFGRADGEAAVVLTGLRSRTAVRVSCHPVHLPGQTWYVLDIFRTGVPACAEALLVTDRRGEIRHVNRAFEAMTGFSKDELAGRTPAILKSGLHGGGTYRELWRTLLDGRVYRGVLVNRRKDGELYHEEKAIQPVPDAGGHPALFVSCGRNVTPRAGAGELRCEKSAA